MKRRLSFLLKTLLWTVLVFIGAKVWFMLACREGHIFTMADVWQVIIHGISLDLSTSLYFLVLPFLLIIVSIWWQSKWMRRVLQVYFLLVSIAFSLAFVADTCLYPFWQFKLDASCLQYLETPDEAAASVSKTYLFKQLIMVVFVTAFIYYGYRSFCVSKQTRSSRGRSILPRVMECVLYLLCIPMMVLGIRGGVDESTTNIGQVYYSQNQFLNHSAVNPVFSFLSSISKSRNYIIQYDYFDEEECAQLTDGIYTVESIGCDTLLNNQRPNILIVIMESCGGQFTEIGGHQEITPHLNQLAKESVYFTQLYANSWRTDKGAVSILSGYPAFPITSVMKIPEKSRKLPSIAKSLQQAGYDNSFYYGGDINFTNMRSYVMSSGYKQLKWKNDYSSEQQSTAKWGVRDDIMVNTLIDDVKNSPNDKPWMKTWLTLSSHEPWDVPAKELDNPVYNAFHYLDNCIDTLITQLKQTPQWDNLLVIILPDHGYRYEGINETTRLYNHIPMIWTGGAVKSSYRFTKVCMQSDLAATLLGQMQLPHEEFTFSRDVLSKTYIRPMAFHTYVNGMAVIDSCGFMSYDLDAKKIIASEGKDTLGLLKLGRALLQQSSHDLISR